MDNITSMEARREEPFSYVRFLHAVPDAPPVDLYINGQLIESNIKYQDFTEYYKARPGTYVIQLYPTGEKTNSILNVTITAAPNYIYTAAAIGTTEAMSLELISDTERNNNPQWSHMRFINLSPNTDSVDIYIDDRLAVRELNFMEVTNYMALTPGNHRMTVKIHNTDEIVVRHPGFTLLGGNYYATYVVGLSGDYTPSIQVLIPLEGSSYLKFPNGSNQNT